MRILRRALFVVFVLAVVLPSAAHAQTETTRGPLEDVVLRGRILRPDGSPLANQNVRVDAHSSGPSIFSLFATAFTGGLSLISCFDGPNELCPITGDKAWFDTTDASGGYSFTFHNAHHRGEQTNTDYVLSVGMPTGRGDQEAIASYELELLDAVHNAPDVVMWDSAITIKPTERSYVVDYKRRPNSANNITISAGRSQLPSRNDGKVIDARAIEDTTVSVTANASKDVSSAGTIYHQRFTATPVELTGVLVPLSRDANCFGLRKDGSALGACGYTDGDLSSPAVDDPNPCEYDSEGRPYITKDVITEETTPCQAPVTEVTVDLGAAKKVGEIRSACGCALTVSTDGANWRNVPSGGVFSATGTMARYVRAKGRSLGSTPEISVWPPWPKQGLALATTTTAVPSKSAAPSPSHDDDGGADHPYVWATLLGLFGAFALVRIAYQFGTEKRPETS